MKTFSFKKGKAEIRHLKEPPKKRKINMERVFFVVLIILLTLYGLYQLYLQIALVRVDGMVTMDKLLVHFTDDVRVLALDVEEGAVVFSGDTLFQYMDQNFEDDATIYTINTSNVESVNRELLQLRRKLEEKRAERRILQNRVRESRLKLEKIRELVALAAYTKRTYETHEQMVLKAEDDLSLVQEEIRYIIRHIDRLRNLRGVYRSRSVGGGSFGIRRFYVAPSDGIIGKINVRENEVCYKPNDVMTIHQPEQLKIQAFFKQEVIEKIEKNRVVDIEFPDGTIQKGIIDKFYVATYALPPEFQKKYEPTERSIVVDILPLDEKNLQGWQQFYKMSVTVSVERFF
ncbi:MAG: hypothetical protein AAFW89_14320 [Bacteroidota bacterium]